MINYDIRANHNYLNKPACRFARSALRAGLCEQAGQRSFFRISKASKTHFKRIIDSPYSSGGILAIFVRAAEF